MASAATPVDLGRRQGTGRPLRAYLTALVVLPLLVCASFAGIAVSDRIGDARSAGRAADLVNLAADLTALQTDSQAELLPALTLIVFKTPVLRTLTHLDEVSGSDIGVSDAQVRQLRAHTDADVQRLASYPGQRTMAQRLGQRIAQSRAQVDSGLGLSAGFASMVALSAELAVRAHDAVDEAVSSQSDAVVNQALQDAELTGSAIQAAAAELPYLSGYVLAGLGAPDAAATVQRDWLRSWGGFNAASAAVLTNGSDRTAQLWRRAIDAPSTTAFEASLTTYATDASRSTDVVGVARLYQPSNVRAAALTRVQVDAVQRAAAATRDARSASTLAAAMIGLLAALVIGLSVAVVVVVRRAIAAPLLALADQAESVSRGELVDVTSDGPREVRTVAGGLSAAVDNLRKIEAQALAVSCGELDSDIVREPLPGELGQVMHSSIATIVSALHDRDTAQTHLEYQATHDGLTELPNRAQALVSVRHAMQRAGRQGTMTGLMFVDLDHFKAVNDTFGHAAGDEVLRTAAARMVACVRESDTVFRLGGDEFVVLLEDTSSDFAFMGLAERIILAVSEPIDLSRGTARIGASVGISVCQDASVDAERLLAEADAAAYSAKQGGRGRVGVFDDALRAALTQRATMERALGLALERDEFELHYQPIVELATARPTGFEALIRWRHPDDGLRHPDDFIPVAEKSTLINQIGRWVLHAATAQLAAWDATGQSADRLTMAVNVSGRQLASTDLLGDVRSALDASGIDPRRLTVEVTETVLIDDPLALHNLHELRALGVAVAIDDFGTGYTSIGQLPNLPVDVLKIDRAFTTSGDPGYQQLVRLIVEAAHAFGLTVVAEGIELSDQVDLMNSLHVDTAQGFFFARPQPPQAAHELAGHASLPSGLRKPAASNPW